MAIMIPEQFTDQNNSHAEERVFKQLKSNLDDTWTVFHSYTMLGRNHLDRLIDAEIDFLLFHPSKGILVLEVKGGQLSFNGNTWHQNGKAMKQSPALQAKHCKYNLLELLSKKLGTKPQLPLGHAVCFPDCYGELSSLPADTLDITINGDMLSFINEEIERILAEFKKGLTFTTSSQNSERIYKILAPHFDYGGSLADKIGNAEQTFLRLTEEQSQLLDFIASHKTALIEGCAGSGKTVMAIKKARSLAKQCDQVLFLCFNRLLCQRVKEELADLPNVRVATYHKFCLEELEKNGFEFTGGDLPPDFWNEEIPSRFADLIAESSLKFDALIVDEGQDFREEYWISISDLVMKGGYFYIFYDPAQNLYNTQIKLPELGTPFLLHKNCRNSRHIFDFLKQCNNNEYKLHEEAPAGCEPQFFSQPNAQLRRKELSKLLSQLVDKEGLIPSQIVLLGGHSMSKTCLREQKRIGKFVISENLEQENAIVYHSLMRFKGCEAEVIILIDVDEQDPRWCAKNLYTAASRARHALYILKA